MIAVIDSAGNVLSVSASPTPIAGTTLAPLSDPITNFVYLFDQYGRAVFTVSNGSLVSQVPAYAQKNSFSIAAAAAARQSLYAQIFNLQAQLSGLNAEVAADAANAIPASMKTSIESQIASLRASIKGMPY